MASFGKESEQNIGTCCIEIQEVLREGIKKWDFSVIDGHRNAQDQNNLYKAKKSQKRYPDSKHNEYPSEAVDIAPYPIDWDDLGSFYLLVGYLIRIAEEKGITLRSGSDWDGDRKTADQDFHDLGHLEIVR